MGRQWPLKQGLQCSDSWAGLCSSAATGKAAQGVRDTGLLSAARCQSNFASTCLLPSFWVIRVQWELLLHSLSSCIFSLLPPSFPHRQSLQGTASNNPIFILQLQRTSLLLHHWLLSCYTNPPTKYTFFLLSLATSIPCTGVHSWMGRGNCSGLQWLFSLLSFILEDLGARCWLKFCSRKPGNVYWQGQAVKSERLSQGGCLEGFWSWTWQSTNSKDNIWWRGSCSSVPARNKRTAIF